MKMQEEEQKMKDMTIKGQNRNITKTIIWKIKTEQTCRKSRQLIFLIGQYL